MDEAELRRQVLNLIKAKSVLKRDVFELTRERFALLQLQVRTIASELKKDVYGFDKRLEIEFKELGDYYCQITIAGDVLLFSMHTNVFMFDENSNYWKSSYLSDDFSRGFCGTIQVYNFLADSFRFNRQNDSGYLLARIFVNKENHFFVEGKKKLGYLFNDFVNSELTTDCMRKIILSIILYTLNFDLFTPEYKTVEEVTVRDVSREKDWISLKTGKRLGFQMSSSDENTPE